MPFGERVQRFGRDSLPSAWRSPVEGYEGRFSVRFEAVFRFPRELLRELHAPEGPDWADAVRVASAGEPGIAGQIEELSEIANAPRVGRADRERYRAGLLSIYSHLPTTPGHLLERNSCHVVAPEREGRILAEAMEWLPPGRSSHPHAKRIGFEGGLLIGFSHLAGDEIGPVRRVLLVDGAIASGATLMACMEITKTCTDSFEIYSVHAAEEGLRGLVRYARALGKDIHITVGHATPGLNQQYYAVRADDPNRVVVGDLGDTIAPLERSG